MSQPSGSGPVLTMQMPDGGFVAQRVDSIAQCLALAVALEKIIEPARLAGMVWQIDPKTTLRDASAA